MPKLVLHSLSCVKTEDITHADNCRLEVRTDGSLHPVKKKKMNDGNSWSLGLAYDFAQGAEIRLFDEDWPDADDNLGSITVSALNFPNASGQFNRDGADYILHYSVEAPVVPNPQSPEELIEQALAEFEASALPGVWSYLSKVEVVSGVRQRITTPQLIDQKGTQFCGPASIAFELARRQPLRYVQICQSLFEVGRFSGRYRTFSASENLRGNGFPPGMAQVDWMLLATMREAENIFLDVGDQIDGEWPEDIKNSIKGLTTPWEICGWIYEVLGYDESNFDNTLLWGEMSALETAREVWNSGGVVFLMINTDLLDGGDAPIAYPDHWVVFNGELSITRRPHKWYEPTFSK